MPQRTTSALNVGGSPFPHNAAPWKCCRVFPLWSTQPDHQRQGGPQPSPQRGLSNQVTRLEDDVHVSTHLHRKRTVEKIYMSNFWGVNTSTYTYSIIFCRSFSNRISTLHLRTHNSCEQHEALNGPLKQLPHIL